MGFSVSDKKRGRAIRARYLNPNFVQTTFGLDVVRETFEVPDNPKMTRSDVRRSDELNKLHATAQANAEDARRVEKLIERKRWSNG